MRRIFPAATLLLAACATAPDPAPPQPAPVVPVRVPGVLVGATAAELVARFGNPALQVREGPGLKMQFRSGQCVLDAYLYPSPGGAGLARVTHADARLPSGADTNQAACISAIEASN